MGRLVLLFCILLAITAGRCSPLSNDAVTELLATVNKLQEEVKKLKKLQTKVEILEAKSCDVSDVDKLKTRFIRMEKKSMFLQKKMDQKTMIYEGRVASLQRAQKMYADALPVSMTKVEQRWLEELVKRAPVKTIACANPIIGTHGYYANDDVIKSGGDFTFDKADEYCKSLGGHLPYYGMKTMPDRTYVMEKIKLVKKVFWIGLTDREEDGVFKWLDNTTAIQDKLEWAGWEPTQTGEWTKKPVDEDCVINWIDNWDTRSWEPYFVHLRDYVCDLPLGDFDEHATVLCEFDCDQ